MTFYRLYHSFRMLLCKTPQKRAQYLKKHNILGAIGDNCKYGPWRLPIYPKLIKLHNNVIIHRRAHIIPHDVLNRFLKNAYPDYDFGHFERIGCIELMDNVYISAHATVMLNVRIGKNCIVSVGSVVTSDIPDNSIVSGIPAKPVGNFEMFAALRRMSRGQYPKFRNQHLSDEMAAEVWEKFEKKHNS